MNGTYLNRKKIKQNKPFTLQNDDKLSFGRHEIDYVIEIEENIETKKVLRKEINDLLQEIETQEDSNQQIFKDI